MENRLLNNEISDSSDSDSDTDINFDENDKSLRKVSQISENFNERIETKNQNLFLKLLNSEKNGKFSGKFNTLYNQRAFTKVPSRLSFCLKDIVPYCYLQGHMFMGLTVCGQFLLSYKVCYDESSSGNNYNFCTYYKYTLYFWIYRPHQLLSKYFKVCMFDDHGVDNLKAVKMTQWLTKPNLLIVHGASEFENEDSYLSIVRVPKLGCLDCKKLRDIDGEAFFRSDALCIKCNLTIHTKYSVTESDPKFNPYTNLISPEHILIIANGFIHMLHIELETKQFTLQSIQHNSATIQEKWLTSATVPVSTFSDKLKSVASNFLYSAPIPKNMDTKNSIVARILADFMDLETECLNQEKLDTEETKKKFNKNNVNNNESQNLSQTSKISKPSTKVSLLNHSAGKRSQRIMTKTFRNGVTTIDLQAANPSTSSVNSAASAYEFSEEDGIEKCEKIATFRKRRLADKKYEFSEDNSENIIPFRKLRSNPTVRRVQQRSASHYHSTGSGTVFLSTQSSQSFENTSHLHRASPSQGFRSPCGSPVGSGGPATIASTSSVINVSSERHHVRSPVKIQQQQLLCKSPPHSTVLMSPNSSNSAVTSSAKSYGTLSPLQISTAKRSQINGNCSPTSSTNLSPHHYGNFLPFLSPRRDDIVFEVPVGGINELPEKPTCTKKFKRHYVEENDAASVITSEEDDCISPGYHTLLPLEVHGSCYSDMQMISQTSYQQLRCHTAIITQNSFDLETFTYYVISNLCQQNNKIYDVFYDWACELINVCPRSSTISCMLMAHFTARDQLHSINQNLSIITPVTTKKCVNCSRNLDCVFHRKQYECRILFSWNIESGDWDVLDYGQLIEIKKIPTMKSVKNSDGGLTTTAKVIAKEITDSLNEIHSYKFNLRVLDSNIDKSKNSLIDLENMIEFYRKKPKMQLLPPSVSNTSSDESDNNTLD